MRSPELALGGDSKTAMPWSHGEMAWLRDQREGELVSASGPMNGQANVIPKVVINSSGKSL